ncbi:CHAP domain-containing protein [Actinomadura rayongensis]
MTYTTDAAIRVAEGEIGYREKPVNDTKYNHWLGAIEGSYRYAWCASFLSWVADRADGRANTDYPRTAGCFTAVDWFRGKGRFGSSPHVGDWVFYGPGGGTHVEMVVAVGSSTITTIGGNTSGSLDGEYFNGDGVYRKNVDRGSGRIYGYGRPGYASNWTENAVRKLPTLAKGAKADNEHVQTLRGLLLARSHPEIATVEGPFDEAVEKAVRGVQKWGKVTVDGVVGPVTWSVLLRVH